MNIWVKVGVGLFSAAVLCTGGYLVVVSSQNTVVDSSESKETIPQQDVQIPNKDTPKAAKALKDFTAFTAESGANEKSSGKLYGKYLLAVNGNQEWWNDIYNKYFRSDAALPVESSKFSKAIVNEGFAGDGDVSNTKLNKVCKEAYEEVADVKENQSKEVKVTFGDEAWRALWKYCSTFDPKFVAADNNADNTTIKSKGVGQLLSAGEGENKELWDLKNKEFIDKGKDQIDDAYFKTLFDDVNSQTLQGKCQAAYDMQEPASTDQLDGTKTKFENVLKFCSLKAITIT